MTNTAKVCHELIVVIKKKKIGERGKSSISALNRTTVHMVVTKALRDMS